MFGTEKLPDYWPEQLRKKWFVKACQGPLRPVTVPIAEKQLDHNMFLHTLARSIDRGLSAGGISKDDVIEWNEIDGKFQPKIDRAKKTTNPKKPLLPKPQAVGEQRAEARKMTWNAS